MEPRPIRCLDALQMRLIPVRAHGAVEQQTVLGSHPGHAVFEEESVAEGTVGAGAELVEEGAFHVS